MNGSHTRGASEPLDGLLNTDHWAPPPVSDPVGLTGDRGRHCCCPWDHTLETTALHVVLQASAPPEVAMTLVSTPKTELSRERVCPDVGHFVPPQQASDVLSVKAYWPGTVSIVSHTVCF